MASQQPVNIRGGEEVRNTLADEAPLNDVFRICSKCPNGDVMHTSRTILVKCRSKRCIKFPTTKTDTKPLFMPIKYDEFDTFCEVCSWHKANFRVWSDADNKNIWICRHCMKVNSLSQASAKTEAQGRRKNGKATKPGNLRSG